MSTPALADHRQGCQRLQRANPMNDKIAAGQGFRFTRDQRLLKPADFQRVFDNVDCKQGGKFCTFLSATNDQALCRLGLIVARRHLRRAVDRNRFKRLVRESFRHNQPGFAQLPYRFDVIVLVKNSAAEADNRAISQELEKQWSKLLARRQSLS